MDGEDGFEKIMMLRSNMTVVVRSMKKLEKKVGYEYYIVRIVG